MGALKVAQWNEGRAAFPLIPVNNGEKMTFLWKEGSRPSGVFGEYWLL